MAWSRSETGTLTQRKLNGLIVDGHGILVLQLAHQLLEDVVAKPLGDQGVDLGLGFCIDDRVGDRRDAVCKKPLRRSGA
ncbi:MAG: hypothetical protein AAFR13_04100, partial [Pseudomonadota bacterium]